MLRKSTAFVPRNRSSNPSPSSEESCELRYGPRRPAGDPYAPQVIRTALVPWSCSHSGLWFDIGLRFDIWTAYRCQRWRTSNIYLFGKFFGFFPLVILMF